MTNDEKIYQTAIGDGMPQTLSTLIVAQARHETGNYTSSFFIIGHNAFGYSYVPGAKWQLSIPGPVADNGKPIAQYANLENSVHELTDWIKRRQSEGVFPVNLATISTPLQYAELLKKAEYYGDTIENYATALLSWLRQIGNLTSGNLGVLAIAIILVAVFHKEIF